MRVLGVDPGLTRCGLGVIDGAPGGRLDLVAVEVLRTPAGAPLGERLLAVESAVDNWVRTHQPDTVAVERVFSQHNVRTVMGTAQASGVAIVAAVRAGSAASDLHPERDQGSGHRHRPGRQDPGCGHGDPPAAPRRAAASG